MRYIPGNELPLRLKREALASYTNRYTRDNVPAWARSGEYALQFSSDSEWLANTLFPITDKGELGEGPRNGQCRSYPTWPDNPELRNRKWFQIHRVQE